ncbi:sulfotransferase family protein [Coleofasciculus chthonoplastes]|uniref:sulfotransferase family protein n=1 Tax=Coleofasciculus chthonoplastes TaxID=64178 RepID=UPI0007C5C1E7|nr:sulfotransferase [Coleofasciculus chthonoplastes]
MPPAIKFLIFQVLQPRLYRPVFIVSAPRSGSSYLYEITRRLPEVWSFDKENDPLWFQFFPYQRLSVPTDYISPAECTPDIIKAFRRELLIENLRHRRPSRWRDGFDYGLLRKTVRYLEKTVANCFHLEALRLMFPDALLVHLVRDGRACVSSMMEGWHSGVFWKRPLPFPEAATISHWCYPIPPGWQTVVHQSLAEICAWSWVEHNRYVLEWERANPDWHKRLIRISYEQLLADPQAVLEQFCQFTGWNMSQESLQYIQEGRLSWTTVSQPQTDKWKQKNGQAINQVMPIIAPMMQQLGYAV